MRLSFRTAFCLSALLVVATGTVALRSGESASEAPIQWITNDVSTVSISAPAPAASVEPQVARRTVTDGGSEARAQNASQP